MGCSCSCCGLSTVQKNIFIVGRSGSGKTHTLYQMLGEAASLDTAPTTVFNNEIINFRRYGRRYEFWDPSGSEDYIQFWESLYKNIAFDVVIYVIDARKYWSTDERQHQIVRDRMELHALLCCPELAHCKVILYLNWKTQLELGEERNMMEVIPNELELYNFPQRDIVTTDTFQTLMDVLLSIPIDEEDEAAVEAV